MDERFGAPSGYNDRPPDEAGLPITEDQRRDFAKAVEYRSREPESAEASEAATSSYMTEFAPHRAVTRLVKTRSQSRNGVQYVREGMTVVCKTADDFVSLRVESRVPKADSEHDEVTRTEYVIDGPDQEVVERKWLVDRKSGERVELPREDQAERKNDLEAMLTFGGEHDADITLPVDDGDPTFTRGRLWEAEDVLAQLSEGGWERSSLAA